MTSRLVNTTVQSASHMGTTPTSLLVKEGMMYPVFRNSASNYGIGSISFADDLSTCSFDVPTLICEALVLGGPCGADVAI